MTQEEARTLIVGQCVYRVVLFENELPEFTEYQVTSIDGKGYYHIYPTENNGKYTLNGFSANPQLLTTGKWFLDKLKAIDHFRQHSLAYYRAELERVETRRESLLETIHNLEH